MKRNVIIRGPKVIVGFVVFVMLVMSLSTLAFADTGEIQDKTITIKTMDEAKTTMADIGRTGINCNLTIKCASQEIVDYVKKELENKPLACMYRPVQVLLDTTLASGNSTTNNSCNSGTIVGTSKDRDESVTIYSNSGNCNQNNCNQNSTNNCQNDTTCNQNTTECNKNTKDCSKSTADSSKNTVEANKDATTCNSNLDASPKTADSTNLYISLVCAAVSALIAVTTLVIRKRRA